MSTIYADRDQSDTILEQERILGPSKTSQRSNISGQEIHSSQELKRSFKKKDTLDFGIPPSKKMSPFKNAKNTDDLADIG